MSDGTWKRENYFLNFTFGHKHYENSRDKYVVNEQSRNGYENTIYFTLPYDPLERVQLLRRLQVRVARLLMDAELEDQDRLLATAARQKVTDEGKEEK